MWRASAMEAEAMGHLAPDLARIGALSRDVSGGAGLSCKSTCCYFDYYKCHICTICRFCPDLASRAPTCPSPSLTTATGDKP